VIGSVAAIAYIVMVFRLDAEASRFVPLVPVIAAGLIAWLPLLLITAFALGRWRALGLRAISES
jgi:hypothetical protein